MFTEPEGTYGSLQDFIHVDRTRVTASFVHPTSLEAFTVVAVYVTSGSEVIYVISTDPAKVLH